MKLNTVSRQKQEFLSERGIEELGLASRRTLQAWRLLGRGPRFIKVGGRSVRYRLADVEAWLAGQTVTPGTKGVGDSRVGA
jgi:predicted DNA-binding transcriptional regulator AlpA